MFNYGKMTTKQQPFIVRGPIIGISPSGDPIYEYERTITATIYVNSAGIDMIQVLLLNPRNYYIVATDEGIIIMMSDDPEQVQFAGCDIIGIDETFGYTYGEGGNVYGMKWNGTAIVDPVSEMTDDQKRERMPNLSARQIRLGLNSLGKLALVDAAIAAMPSPQKEDAQIEWEYGTEFRRLHPLITMIIPLLELTPEEVDTAWMTFSTK